ncbi:hypothetical protein V1511DRAFT_504704 [Dipodascopsis uninucleata]
MRVARFLAFGVVAANIVFLIYYTNSSYYAEKIVSSSTLTLKGQLQSAFKYYSVLTQTIPVHCIDPYRQPGYLSIPNATDFSTSRYVPFYEDVLFNRTVDYAVYPAETDNLAFSDSPVPEEILKHSPINWMALLREHVYYSKKTYTHKRKEYIDSQVDWLRNRRILMLSDSVDRYMAIHFCSAIGLEGVFGPGGKHTTAWCTVPSLNFTIYHWHVASMFTFRPDWWWMTEMEYVAWEDRLEHLYLDTLPEVIGMNGYSPDLILYQSSLWDLFAFVKNYQENFKTTEGSGSNKRQIHWSELEFYIQRSRVFIKSIRNLFGNDVPIMYRTAIQHRNAGITDLPLYNLDRAARFVAHQADIEIFDWGKMMAGFQDEFTDNMHVGLGPLSWLYSNMLMYYLFRALGGAEYRGKVVEWPSAKNITMDEAWGECHIYNMNLENR